MATCAALGCNVDVKLGFVAKGGTEAIAESGPEGQIATRLQPQLVAFTVAFTVALVACAGAMSGRLRHFVIFLYVC